MAIFRCHAFAGVRRDEEQGGYEYLDRDTIASHPDEVERKAKQLDPYTKHKLIRVAPVVIEERHEAFHDMMLATRARARAQTRSATLD